MNVDGTLSPIAGRDHSRLASLDEVQDVARVADRVRGCIGQVIVGKREVIDLVLVALLGEGHVLFEDVPGLGKTMLARAAARALDCAFQRIQFTPDLLPSDVTGLSIFNQKTQEFEYRAGPVFTNLLLADEINRATPRTQSALLEAMAERQVTVDGDSRRLPRPFVVMATQNPIELEGTFPLPEAQLDRFALRVSIGYPREDEELAIARRFEASDPLKSLDAVVDRDDLARAIDVCQRVRVGDAVAGYLVALVRATRVVASVALGASPRATLTLWRSAQALAALDGRPYVLPDDVKRVAPSVLCHRLILRPEERARGRTADAVVAEVLDRAPVPVEVTE
ncbi:MAG: AAA family ATPase [Chloroflexota bacterium]